MNLYVRSDVYNELIEKGYGKKDLSKLTAKIITDKNGHRRKVYVKTEEKQSVGKPSTTTKEPEKKKNTVSSVIKTIQNIYPDAEIYSQKARTYVKDVNGNKQDVKFEYIKEDSRFVGANENDEKGVSVRIMGEDFFIPENADAKRFIKNIVNWKLNKGIYSEKGNYKEKAVEYVKTMAQDDSKYRRSIDYIKENKKGLSEDELKSAIDKHEWLVDPKNSKESHVTEVESNYRHLLAFKELLSERENKNSSNSYWIQDSKRGVKIVNHPAVKNAYDILNELEEKGLGKLTDIESDGFSFEGKDFTIESRYGNGEEHFAVELKEPLDKNPILERMNEDSGGEIYQTKHIIVNYKNKDEAKNKLIYWLTGKK